MSDRDVLRELLFSDSWLAGGVNHIREMSQLYCGVQMRECETPCNAHHAERCGGVQGEPFDIEARRPFINRLLSSRTQRPPRAGTPAAMGPLKSAVARTALMYLIQSNMDLLDSCIDQCYASDPVVARAHFKARKSTTGSDGTAVAVAIAVVS